MTSRVINQPTGKRIGRQRSFQSQTGPPCSGHEMIVRVTSCTLCQEQNTVELGRVNRIVPLHPSWLAYQSTTVYDISFTYMHTGWCPPVINWFITPSKYNDLRIIHYCYYSYLHQLSDSELGPHPWYSPRVPYLADAQRLQHLVHAPQAINGRSLMLGY